MQTPTPANPKGGFKRHLGLSLASNVVFALCQALVILIVARAGTAEQVGFVTLATAIVAPVFAFSDMSMRAGRAVDSIASFTYAEYVAVRFLTLLVGLIVIAVILVTGYSGYSATFLAAAAAMTASRGVLQQTQLATGVFESALRMDLVARLTILRGVLGVVAFAIAFVFSQSLAFGFLAQAFALLLVTFTFQRRALAQIGTTFDRSMFADVRTARIWRLFVWLFPLALSAGLFTLSAAVPRLLLADAVSISALGLFGAIAYMQTAFQVVVQSVARATASWQARAYANGQKRRFFRTFTLAMFANFGLGGMIVLAGHLLGASVTAALFGAEYVNQGVLVPIAAAIAVNLLSSAMTASVVASRKFWLSALTNVLTFLVVCIAGYALIPDGGAEAAALTILIGALTRLAMAVVAFLLAVRQFPAPSVPAV